MTNRGCYIWGSGEETLVYQPFLLVPKQIKIEINVGDNKMTKHKRGFTLIEVLVVVLIIGILVAVALPQYQRAVMKSRYTGLINLTDTLADAEELYYLTHGTYTNNFEELDVMPGGCALSADKTQCTFSWGSCAISTLLDDVISCVDFSLQNGYARYFRHGKLGKIYKRECHSFSSNLQDQYSKLCEYMGGTKRHNYKTATCPPFGACAIYDL